jgi:hypothetical protein
MSRITGPKIFEPVTGHRRDFRRCKTSHEKAEKGPQNPFFVRAARTGVFPHSIPQALTKCQFWFALAKVVDLRCDGS